MLIVIPAFCNVKTLAYCLSRLEQTLIVNKYQIHVLYNHYPKTDIRQFKTITGIDYNIYLHDSGGDFGLAKSFNLFLFSEWWANHIAGRGHEYVICLDPSDSVDRIGWEVNLLNIAKQTKAAMTVAWNDKLPYPTPDPYEIDHAGNHMESPVCYDLNWLFNIGGFAQTRPFYGGFEMAMQNKLGGRLKVYVPSVMTNKTGERFEDATYKQWKKECLDKRYMPEQMSFQNWLDFKGLQVT